MCIPALYPKLVKFSEYDITPPDSELKDLLYLPDQTEEEQSSVGSCNEEGVEPAL